MGRHRRTFFLIIVVSAILAIPSARPLHAQGDVQYFPQTGHTVAGEFLDFYQAQPNAAMLFGYPITEAFIRDGQRIQYFQRALFQQKPGTFPTLASLGKFFYEHPGEHLHRELLPIPGWNIAGCEHVPGIDGRLLPVCYEFLEFYRQYSAIIGPPVSAPLLENGVPVQYFEAARLEYRTESGQVTLSNLGAWYFQQYDPEPSLRNPITPASNAPARLALLLHLHAMVTVSSVLTHPGEQEHLLILVTDQLGEAVAGATVHLAFTDASGHPLETPLTHNVFQTDANGRVTATLTVPDYRGHIAIHVHVTFRGITGEAQTAFRVWH